MKARAPGKLVLSGAYAILRGAPAIVTAVDRFAYADAAEASTFETAEVQAALELLGQPHSFHPSFDASELRLDGRKLGLGSSAAILVASLFALLDFDDAHVGEREQTYALAREAHRKAQGGGSGVDVAAAFFGGTLRAELRDDKLEVSPVSLPPGLFIEVWALPSAASTADFVRRVFAQEGLEDSGFADVFAPHLAASQDAALALVAEDALGFVSALRRQHAALLELGTLCAVPIVLPVVQALHELLPESCCFLPAGAGGGDISVYFGLDAAPPAFEEAAREAGLVHVALSLGAGGASRFESADVIA